MPPHSTLLGQLYRLTSPPPSDAELLRRWVERRDEDAFTALVARHGRMVHGVCRRVLGNSHDAEDAFQAVFLTLARKAAALRHPEALPGWLHGVAVRLACKARTAAARRRCESADAPPAEPHDPHPDPLEALSARELLGLIDREIVRLPEKYRLPLVLCDLEERTQAEAAQMLGWTLGSFRGRLLRGRERLRIRLARRGIAPAVLVAAKMQGTADAAALATSISRLAVRFAACPASAEISPSVAILLRGGIGSMMLAKVRLASVVVLAISTLVAGAGLFLCPISAPKLAEERAEDTPPPVPPSAKPPIRHDRAGDPLPPEALSRLGTVRFRHGGFIESLAFAPGGKTLVSCGWDGIRVWDAATGKEIPRFPKDLQAHSIALSPDGKKLAVRLRTDKPSDPSLAIYDFATARLLRRFGDMETTSMLLFSPDGKVLAAYYLEKEIELWDPAGGHRLHILKGHKAGVWSIAFSADSKTLTSSGDDKTIRFWDVATGKEVRQIQHSQGLGKTAVSPDGKFIASIDTILHHNKEFGSSVWTNDNHVRIWDKASGKELRQLLMPARENPLHPKMVDGFRSLRFSPDGKTLLTGGEDGILRIWDPVTGRELRQFPGFTICPSLIVFAPDNKSLAVVDGLYTLRLLDLATGEDCVSPGGHRGRVFSISVTPDNQAVATIGQDNILRLWEPATGRELHRRAASVDFSPSVGLRADGQTYLTVGPDKLYRLHDLSSGEERAVLRGHRSQFPFALSPDAKTLASVNDDKEVRLLDPATGTVRHALTKVKHTVNGMSFTADGRTLVAWDADQIITIWDAATGKKLRQFSAPAESGGLIPASGLGMYYTAALSPDGKLLAIGLQVFESKAKRAFVPILDTNSGKVVRRFQALEDGGECLSFSPDGKTLAWSGWRDRTIHLGEIATGRVRRVFSGHPGRVQKLVFSADGRMLISGSDDTTALVWDLTGRLTMGRKFDTALSVEELETQWMTLSGKDAEAAFRSIQTLAADSIRSIPYLRKRLHPIASVDEEHLQQWIADLDSDHFAAREKAASELEKAGEAALHAMRKTLGERPSLETRRRLEQLIEKQKREEWSPSEDGLRSRRAVEVLERVGTAEAKDVLNKLANGAPGAWQTRDAKAALERLAQRRIR